MKWLLLMVVTTGCFGDDSGPISSKVSLDGETWTASAFSSDVASPQTVTIVLTRDLDASCSYTAFGMVELDLLIGDRSMPHTIAPLDVTGPNSHTGFVYYTDDDQNVHPAVSGRVTPGLTAWAYSASEGHNVVTQVDGDFEVTLDNGQTLTGAFSASPCAVQR